MKIEFPESFADKTAEEIVALRAAALEKFNELVALDAPTDEDLIEAARLGDGIDAIDAHEAAKADAETKRAEELAALRTRFSNEPEKTDEEKEAEAKAAEEAAAAEAERVAAEAKAAEEAEAAAVAEAERIAAEEAEKVAAASKTSARQALAAKTARPLPPKKDVMPVTITAAADVPDFATGSAIESMTEVGNALVSRMRGFGTPSGDGSTENLQHYGVAKFALNFDDDMRIDEHSGNHMEVLERARKESRLEGGSLTAAGGWCAPSETLYDLCVTGETLDGILSVPEVAVNRGGIRYTSGPDFAAIYGAGAYFDQTEAQAIAGTTKPCYEVPCPSFTDVRLDAVGVCIKAPILTFAAYPEVVNRWLSGAMVAHQHKINAKVIAKIETLSTAKTIAGIGSAAHDTLSGLDLRANVIREQYRMGLTETMEVVVPFWVKSVIKDDLAVRTGRPDGEAIQDSEVDAHFASRHLSVSFVYDWQALGDVVAYPANFKALMYPAGTFVKGTTDVITLNAVYDAASLATNVYTALFFEAGVLVAKMCATSNVVTIPICAAGRTGAANFTCA